MKNWVQNLPKLADIYTGLQVFFALTLILMGRLGIHINYAIVALMLMNFCNANAYYCTFISQPRRRLEYNYDYWRELAPRINFTTSTLSGFAMFDYADLMINHDFACTSAIVIIIVCVSIQCMLYEYDGFGFNLIQKQPKLAHTLGTTRWVFYVVAIYVIMFYYLRHATWSPFFDSLAAFTIFASAIVVATLMAIHGWSKDAEINN